MILYHYLSTAPSLENQVFIFHRMKTKRMRKKKKRKKRYISFVMEGFVMEIRGKKRREIPKEGEIPREGWKKERQRER